MNHSPYEYYENRPDESNEDGVDYEEVEMAKGYWDDLSIAEFWANYAIVYAQLFQLELKFGKIW